jgi:hypothetical protein
MRFLMPRSALSSCSDGAVDDGHDVDVLGRTAYVSNQEKVCRESAEAFLTKNHMDRSRQICIFDM